MDGSLSPLRPEDHIGVESACKNGRGGSAIDWFDILKWVLIVLAAGFIAQFGKRLADHLVSRARHRSATTSSPPPPSPTGEETRGNGSGQASSEPRSADDLHTKTVAKIAKKAAKAEVKRRK
ncbi:MAG: hypothetical protein V1912_01220 [bacterium]